MIKNILLDLDDTLFDFHIAEAVALKKALTELGIEPTQEVIARYSEINEAQWKLHELGELTLERVKTRRYELLLAELHRDIAPEVAARTYEGYLAQGHYFMEGAEELLENLSGKYRLYLASNGIKEVQRGRLASAGIEHYFEQIFISEEIGYNKPDVRYFEACFNQIPDMKKEETIMVGDSLTSDIKGGNTAGIRTVWLQHTGKEAREDIVPSYTIHKLDEIYALLDEIK